MLKVEPLRRSVCVLGAVLPQSRNWSRGIARGARGILLTCFGTECWPATSLVSSSKAPTPEHAQEKHHLRPASDCTSPALNCSNVRTAGSTERNHSKTEHLGVQVTVYRT